MQPQALETLGTWAREGMPGPWGPLCKDVLNGLISDDYWELLGTSYLRVHDYATALRRFEHVSPVFTGGNPTDWYADTGEVVLYPNPFSAPINDYPKVFGNTNYTKVQFAQTMAHLQAEVKRGGKDLAESYFQLANGVYQTGAFGNSWQFISYDWSSTDNYIKGNYYYSGDFHDAKQAAEWYAKARELSTDKEFRALCTFMLAKCEQRLFGFGNLGDYYDDRYRSDNPADSFWVFSQKNKYFDELKTGYQDTQFFKKAIHECSYLADFIY